MHSSNIIVQIFNTCFEQRYNTLLEEGGQEPIYLPAHNRSERNRIIFSHDYFASALHEIAHWCVAGAVRRTQQDYGYWYAPDGRSAEQQVKFEQVEVKPQALEWLFSRAANFRFRLSADNLASGVGPSDVFARRVVSQAQEYCERGVNSRAGVFITALASFYNVSDVLNPSHYRLEYLRVDF